MNIRLYEIYTQIPFGKGVIDVGTDHGYLPAYLAKLGYPGKIYASDINEGPLASAIRTAKEEHVEDKIEFILSDGLSACPYENIDTIVIAGMGGDLICRILDSVPWVNSPEYKLILQPMTKAEVVRYWLSNNDFEISKELLVEDGNLYQIITARHGKARHLSDAELFTGEFSLICRNKYAVAYFDSLLKRFRSIILGLKSADSAANIGRIEIYEHIFTELEKMRNEL